MTKQYFNFNYKEVFRFSWTKTVQHAWFIVCTAMIAAIVLSATYQTKVLDVIIPICVALSVVSIAITIVRDHSFTFSDLYKPLLYPKIVANFFAVVLAYIVVALLCAMPIAGFFQTVMMHAPTSTSSMYLLFTPITLVGIYYSVRLKFLPFVIVESPHMNLDAIVKRALSLTQGMFWKIFGFLLILGLFNLLGLRLYFVGLIITVPVSIFAVAYLYKKSTEHSN
jgi:uncharacterized membrane protein (DUF373 family)